MLKTRVKAVTLLECLVALLVISGSMLVYQGLTKLISSNVHYLSTNRQEDWLLFSQQLHSELAESQFVKLEGDKLYVKRGQQELAFGKSKDHDFRKTNADGRGYQPMLMGLKKASFKEESGLIRLELTFETGLERTFIYAFKEKT